MSEEIEEKQAARPMRLLGRFLKRSWRGLVVLVVAIALGVAAYLSPGLVEADVRLDEGTIYVGKRDSGLVGTVNAQIDELTQAAQIGGSDFVVLQDKDLLLVHGRESATLSRILPGRNTVAAPTVLTSANTRVQLVGDQLLVYNPQNGRAWHGDAETVLDFDFQKEKAHLEIGENGVATLTTDGDILAVDPNTSELIRTGEEGRQATALPFTIDPLVVNLEVSAVGDKAVVLDKTSGRIWVEGMSKTFSVSGASTATLMAPAPDALRGDGGAKAIYSTQAGLIALTNDGPRSLSGAIDATPVVRPVQVANCAYGAFGDQFVKKCVGQDAERVDIPSIPTGEADLAFHVNRTTVALNDQISGRTWLVNKGMKVVDNWDQVIPPEADDTQELQERSDSTPPDRTQKNRDPIAQDDTLSARVGRSTVLTVLDNDTDPDGDVLTISAPAEVEGASIQLVRGGAGLQITLLDDAKGPISFSYDVIDGRTGRDSAQVTVNVISQDASQVNGEPYRFHLAQPLRTTLGEVVETRALLDWRDPEGDPLVLEDAWMEGTEDFVEFSPDGTITYFDVGKTTGSKVINVKVSDGYTSKVGEVPVIVSDEVLPPVAHGDFATGMVGELISVNPLVNDVGPITHGQALRLTEVKVTECNDCELTPNYREGTFSFKAAKAGTYYVVYTVRTGPPATGLVRIDVRAAGTSHPPVAALDVALLPPGGSVLIDPLLNDSDPDGDVLVIQQVTEHPALEVVLERRHLVTIKAKFTPDAPVTLHYWLSDGQAAVKGTIVVIPTKTTGSTAPQATDDSVQVRAGSTVTADVLRNDSSPIGLPLTLTKVLDSPFGDGVWIDGERLRISVPAGLPRQNTSFDYQITDSDGKTTSARVRVEVISEDAQNEAPAPRQVIDRVLADSTTRIPIDLQDIDPNGDAVRLVGLDSGPTLGRVTGIGEEYITYHAYPESKGTDVFRYAVVDALGMKGIGEVRIGVAPPSPTNIAPTGVTDEVTVRPGRQVQISAVDNDRDIDGDQVSYANDNPATMDDPSIDVRLVDKKDLVLTAPQEVGTYTGRYKIKDTRGMESSGRLTIIVAEDAPLAAPVTRDDSVALSSIADKDWASIDVRANDYDPDGPREELVIDVPPYGAPEDRSARVDADGQVTVPILDRMQQVRYTATDADGNSTSGLVIVPGRGDSVPVLRDAETALEAVAGQPLTFALEDHVVGTEGRPVKLTSAENVSGTHGSAKPAGPSAVDFVPHADYQGPASVVFEVSDVVPEGDTSAKTAYISMMVTVRPAPNRPQSDDPEAKNPFANQAPRLVTANPFLQVGPGEGEEALDLTSLFVDPEGQTFRVKSLSEAGGGGAISWEQRESRLVANAPESAQPGDHKIVRGSVVDAGGAEADFEVRIEVTPSRMDRITAVTDVHDGVIAGTPLTFDPTLDDKSHLLNDKTITLLDAKIISGEGTISQKGNTVTITPSPGTHGTLTATYTVIDATQDPNRRVEGTIRVTVKDKPATPLTPFAGTAGDGTISVKYKSGGDGGSAIISRIATATSPGLAPVTASCGSEVCTVNGVRNGRPWTVSVVEANDVGASESSPQSEVLLPDAKPLPPSKPTTQFGDRQLTISWTHDKQFATELGGSDIKAYHLQRFNASGQLDGAPVVVPGGGSARSYTWTGLTNGTPYTFEVVAENAQFKSDPSAASNPDWGTGKPIGSIVPTVTTIQDDIGGGFRVSFDKSAINNNGGTITQYVVTPVTQGGGPSPDRAITITSAPNQEVSATITGMGQSPTKFSVSATNRAGDAVVGGTSEYLISYPLPRFRSVRAEAGDGQVTWSVETNLDPSAPVTVKYSTGGGWKDLPSDGRVTGLVNGEEYTFQFQAFVGDRQSSVLSADHTVMPRSESPTPASVDTSTFTLVSEDSATGRVVPGSDDWVATGGWDPSNYVFCNSAYTSNCRDADTDRTRTFDVGAYNYFRWAWGNERLSEYQTVSLRRVDRPSYDSRTGDLSAFTFPYVQSGRCTVVSQQRNGDLISSFEVEAGGGAVSYDGGKLMMPNPAYTPETPNEPQEIPVPRATVNCTLNSFSTSYSL